MHTACANTNKSCAPPAGLQVSVVRYRFRENCTEAKYAAVLGAFNAWQPWTLPKEVALAEVQCGYDSLQVQVRLANDM